MNWSEFAQLLLSLTCILAMARALGLLAQQFKQPAVMGELAAGLVVGPTLLGRFLPDSSLFASVATTLHLPAYLLLVKISSIIVMFVSGFDVDLARLWKDRVPIALVSAGGFVFPFICGVIAALAFPMLALPVGDKLFGMLFWGAAMTMTSLPVIARIFFELNVMHTSVASRKKRSAASSVFRTPYWCTNCKY
jgi:Kef-type K+ transport system membrane component KefB